MSNLVKVESSKVVASSQQVAKVFEKEHRNIMRDIRNLINDMGYAQNCADLFYEVEYLHPQNKQVYKEYLMNRDGFTLLAMGFTGTKALKWKIKYINAFNEMEQQLQNIASYMIEDPIARAKAWIIEQEERKALQATTQKQEQIIGELKPKADYTDEILKNSGLVTITQIAKDYGMSGQKMNEVLHKLKIQYKQSGQWLLYSNHHEKGYTHSHTTKITRKDGTPDIIMNTKWTQKEDYSYTTH